MAILVSQGECRFALHHAGIETVIRYHRGCIPCYLLELNGCVMQQGGQAQVLNQCSWGSDLSYNRHFQNSGFNAWTLLHPILCWSTIIWFVTYLIWVQSGC